MKFRLEVAEKQVTTMMDGWLPIITTHAEETRYFLFICYQQGIVNLLLITVMASKARLTPQALSSYNTSDGPLAQLAEQMTLNQLPS